MTKEDPETHDRFETVISAAAPFLDLMLAIGDRVSRILEPKDYEYYPVRDEDPEEVPPDSQ
ncbi:MAG: hypothetical protein WD118_05945 [Phycisphaeraceae bacterium]